MTQRAPSGKQLADFIAYVNRVAHNVREDAGYAGSWSDNGASRLESDVKTWHAGLEGKIPESLKGYWVEFERSLDPEYSKFLELKKKFG